MSGGPARPPLPAPLSGPCCFPSCYLLLEAPSPPSLTEGLPLGATSRDGRGRPWEAGGGGLGPMGKSGGTPLPCPGLTFLLGKVSRLAAASSSPAKATLPAFLTSLAKELSLWRSLFIQPTPFVQ